MSVAHFFSLREKKKVMSKVRFALVLFVRRAGDTLEFTSETLSDVSLCVW